LLEVTLNESVSPVFENVKVYSGVAVNVYDQVTVPAGYNTTTEASLLLSAWVKYAVPDL
jgi:hypothetical protein